MCWRLGRSYNNRQPAYNGQRINSFIAQAINIHGFAAYKVLHFAGYLRWAALIIRAIKRGFAFLSFGPDDPGVVSWEKLLRYWESADGGQFRVTRVDLEDGGHLLILRKVEARVGLWLRPRGLHRVLVGLAPGCGRLGGGHGPGARVCQG